MSNRSEEFRGRASTWLVASATSILLLAGAPRAGRAEEAATRTFSSADEAARALFQAVRDDDASALEAILGPDLTGSGPASEEKLERHRFDEKYCEMHRLVQEPDGATRLYVGAENWPFPVPLMTEGGQWRFDTEAGRQEILRRRVGQDEAAALRVCESRAGAPADEPFHGYYFRVVPPRAHEQKARGVAFVAYPAEYRATGVMTFVVTRDGALWEQDLGPETPSVAPRLTSRASGWRAVATHG
jgi:hypothetical protein